MGFHFLLQGIFPTQGWNPCLLHWQTDCRFFTTEPPGKPLSMIGVSFFFFFFHLLFLKGEHSPEKTQSFMLLDLRKGCSLCLEHRSSISHGSSGPLDCSSGLFPLHPWAASGIQVSSRLCVGDLHFLPTWGSPPPPPCPARVPAVDGLHQRGPLPHGQQSEGGQCPQAVTAPGSPEDQPQGLRNTNQMCLLQIKPTFRSSGGRAIS